jgi:hypothetical protein
MNEQDCLSPKNRGLGKLWTGFLLWMKSGQNTWLSNHEPLMDDAAAQFPGHAAKERAVDPRIGYDEDLMQDYVALPWETDGTKYSQQGIRVRRGDLKSHPSAFE